MSSSISANIAGVARHRSQKESLNLYSHFLNVPVRHLTLRHCAAMEWATNNVAFENEGPIPSGDDVKVLTIPDENLRRSIGTRTVAAAFQSILGCSPLQKDLIAFRVRFFKSVLPPLTRTERRIRTVHMMTLERYKNVLLPLLERSDFAAQLVNIALENRKGPERERILMHLFDI
jgi:hypothetical protein